ncbi:MAG: CDP-glycerol glycerophosphotransferase family protein [Eubacterium sp.]|nr:CDP-glycerol glycerophosphotransferase family protein [Eubacterium sp.]
MNKVSYILKSSRFLYGVYYYVMSALLRLLGVFVGQDDKMILFNSYGGKKYNDSPKEIYEYMLSDHRFDGYKFVWAVQEPDKESVPGRALIIKTDSFRYFVTALRAKMWVTNSSMERGLDFKKKGTVCFNTWHGTPIKSMGIDINDGNQSFKSKSLVRADIMLAQSQYDIIVFTHAFKLPQSVFKMIGLPRNDNLLKYKENDICRIRKDLGITENKTVILYAPTFREYTKGKSKEVILDIPIDCKYWQEVLGEKFIVLFRAHYEAAEHVDVSKYPLFIDVSDYQNLSDLIIASDALISDYSSVFFDYSITHKPMFCFAYDYDEYLHKRGMYLDLETEMPFIVHRDEATLINELRIMHEHYESFCEKTTAFQEKYVTVYGQATERSCDLISDVLSKG